jgi:hypothetical protein
MQSKQFPITEDGRKHGALRCACSRRGADDLAEIGQRKGGIGEDAWDRGLMALSASDALGWGAVSGPRGGQHIAGQWAEQPSVVPMAEPQPVGLMVEQPFVGLMVVRRCAVPTAELRFEAPYMVPTMAGIVPTLVLQRGSRLGGCRCGCGFDLLLFTTLLPTGTLLLPTLVVCSISW